MKANLYALASTALLMGVRGQAFTWHIGLAAAMILGAAILSSMPQRLRRITH